MNDSLHFRPERSGVYRAPPELAPVREAAQRAGCAFFEVNLACVRDKAGFLAAAARDLKFPAHFGGNWDAFADCIADPGEDRKGRVIALHGADAFAKHAPDDWATALEILHNAAEEWRARKRTFVVLVDYEDAALRLFS